MICCLRTRKHFAIRIEDVGGRVRFSPWFDAEEQALSWLNSDETGEDHQHRFTAPMYCLQEYWEPRSSERDMICGDYRYLFRTAEGGQWQ
jgi:hypothetical protein